MRPFTRDPAEPTMNRKLQGIATREKILDAAELVFATQGAEYTSLEDIAREAHATRGAIYGHFDNKMALLDALFKRAALPMDPFTIPLRDHCEAPFLRLRQDLQRRLRDVLSDGTTRRLYSILFSASVNNPLAPPETLNEASQLAQARIAAVLRAAQAIGEIDEVDSSHEASMIHALLLGYFRRSLLCNPESRPSDSAAEIVRHALRTIIATRSFDERA